MRCARTCSSRPPLRSFDQRLVSPIIFLDLDGVLNTGTYTDCWLGNSELLPGYTDRDRFGLHFTRSAVAYLEELIRETTAEVVISSSWRYEGMPFLEALWTVRRLPGRLRGMLPLLEDEGYDRGSCLAAWLAEHPVDKYVIIDDTNDFSEAQQPHLVLTDPARGIDLTAYQQAKAVLMAMRA